MYTMNASWKVYCISSLNHCRRIYMSSANSIGIDNFLVLVELIWVGWYNVYDWKDLSYVG